MKTNKTTTNPTVSMLKIDYCQIAKQNLMRVSYKIQ